MSWEVIQKRVLDALRQAFRPEFLNRVDDVIVFRQLSHADLGRIVDLQLQRVNQLVADRRLSLDVAPEVKEFLIETGYDPAYGARPLKRVIQREIQNPLALAILEGDYADGDTVKVVRASDGKGLEFVRVATAKEGGKKEGRAATGVT